MLQVYKLVVLLTYIMFIIIHIKSTPYECHGALMEKEGFGLINNSYALGKQSIIKEAIAFLTQFAEENNDAYSTSGGLEKRIEEMKREVEATGTYVQTFDELQYGCRLAWRNSGRCIMRKVCLYVHYLQCGFITTVLSFFFQLAPIGLFHPRVTG